MRIESPNDFEYSESGLGKPNLRIPNTRILINNQKFKKRKNPLKKTQKFIGKGERQQNYFQLMYKQVKRNTYVNLFIRKLKQASISKHGINHKLCQEQNYSNFRSLQTFLFKREIQMIYTALQILLVLVASITTSLVLAFPFINETQPVRTISLLTLIYSGVNLFLSFFSRSSIDFKNEKKSYKYVKQTVQNFKNFWSWVDILVLIIFFIDWLNYESTIIYFKLIVIVKIINIFNKITNLQILLISNCFREQYWDLLKILFFNFLFAHFLAIVLLLMSNNGQKQNWLSNKGLTNYPWNQKYIWSYYWATTIMLTVGFGDISPVSTKQVIVMIFIQMLSCIVLGYNINSVGKIIKKITSYQQQKVSNLKIFTQMQAKQNVSQDIKKKITNYITQSTQLKRNFNVDQQKQLIQKLPKTFYDQFRKQSNFNIFGSIPFFRNLNFSKLRQIALKIDKKLTHPQEIIVEGGSVPGVIIVNNGQITYTMNRIGLPSHGKQIQSLKVDSQQYKILSLYFFINKPIFYDIKCKDFAIVYSISKKQLQNILSTNYSSYQYYCMTKDKDRYNPNDWQIHKCELCEHRSFHTLVQCPKLHYVPIRDIVVSKILRKNPQKIKNLLQTRKGTRIMAPSINPLKNYNQIQKQCKQINALAIVKSHLLRKCEKRKGIYESKKKIINIKGTSQIADNPLQFQQQLQKILKLKYYEKLQNKKENNFNISQVCKQVGEKLKDELLKTSFFNAMDFGFDMESDVAYDYASYFHSYNPCMLSKRKIFEKNPIHQFKNIY